MAESLRLYKAKNRGQTKTPWLASWHSFNFNDFYDKGLNGFGALLVLNDDTIMPGKGFGMHGHSNMEIITIVLDGSLMHKDSMGHSETIERNEVQVMSAGTGIMHSESNNSDKTLNLLQIWIVPDKDNIAPRYAQEKLDMKSLNNKFQKIVEGKRHDEKHERLYINQDASLSLGIFDKGEKISHDIGDKHGMYVFVIKGKIYVNDNLLEEKDALGIYGIKHFFIICKEPSKILLIEVPMK
jgi:hypothetical protein